jgi:CBS domain-containing protein
MGSAKDNRRVVTDLDAERISRVEELSYELKIGQVMTADVQTVTPEMQIIEVLDLFRQMRISGAPVLDQEQLVGLISRKI